MLFCLCCNSELLLAGRYRTTTLLSDKGGFGNTYEVTHNGDAKVLKVLTNNQPKAVQLFEQEYRVLNQLNHPGIPRGEHYFTFFPRNSQTPLYCLVMEYIRGMDLEEYQKNRGMRPIEQKLALEWLLQLTQILDAVHSEEFFHRDIKPSNIILKPDGQLVLIDFGGARQVTATIMAGGLNTALYTPGYAPPEQEKGYAVPQSDFYALGRTMVYLLTGKQPTAPELYNPNTDEFLWRKEAPELSAQLGNFIDWLMARSASERPANTRVILQKLERLQRHLYPPKVRQPPQPHNTGVPSTISIIPPSGKGPSPSSPRKTRRGFLKVTAGLAGGGLVTAVVGRQL
ncbi:MAG: serine/threonine protein kinase [Hormoscilla sp. GUM202]|nr:serine/threonine protein kinase [Hormoscilla sp. GUM202]